MKTIYKITLFLASIAILASCGTKTIEATEEEHHHDEEGMVEFTSAQFKRSGIEFGKVEMKNLSSTISVNGALDVPPQNMVSVSAIMGGFVKSTELLQGMRVRKGEVILTIQNPDFIPIQSMYLENKQKLKYLELEYKRQEELSKENVAATKTFQQVSSEYNSLLATIGASSAVGGLVFSSSAKSLKYAAASSALTCSRTAVFMSCAASTVAGGGV